MTTTILIFALATLVLVTTAASVYLWVSRGKIRARVSRLNEETLEASRDASVGHRLTVPNDPETAQLAHTVNRLFDALGERDEKIQGRDRLFQDFARTLPEIVIIHDEKILLANESAAGLVGLEPAQLVGREIADLVKPAYRALFRKTVTKRITALLLHSGIDGLIALKKFTSHSFRSGAASELAKQHATEDVIRNAGRWKSDAVQVYIETVARNPEALKRIGGMLASSPILNSHF